MPHFLFVADEPRTFPDAGIEATPGATVEADKNPDTRFFVEVDAPAPTSEPSVQAQEPAPEPAPVPEPAVEAALATTPEEG